MVDKKQAGGTADTVNSKSTVRKCVPVQVWSSAENRPVSTEKKNEMEALQAVFVMLRKSVLRKRSAIIIQDFSLKNMVRKIKNKA